MAGLVTFKNVRYTIGTFTLKNICLSIKEGEYFVILGPSGTGKTQLLRVLAGLSRIDSGEIWIGGERKDHLPPEQRGIGFVFQDHVLFPHMPVFDNIAFSLRLRRLKGADIRSRVEDVAEMLGISDLLDRIPTHLSGGEKQRVALARAMVSNPKILVLDEPYANLDRNLAERLTLEARDLHRRIKQTTIHVTHNQEEAIILADRLCLMQGGEIRMIGTPDEIFRRPNSCFVADFVGTANIYREAALVSGGDGIAKIVYKGKEIHCESRLLRGCAGGKGFGETNGEVTFCVRPENTTLYAAHPEKQESNVFKGRIVEIYDRGVMFQSLVDIDGDLSVINLTMRGRFLDLNIGKGSPVYIHIDTRSVHIIEGEGKPKREEDHT